VRPQFPVSNSPNRSQVLPLKAHELHLVDRDWQAGARGLITSFNLFEGFEIPSGVHVPSGSVLGTSVFEPQTS